MIKVTSKQRQAYQFIKSYIKKNSFPPTIKEVGVSMGVYPNAAQGHVDALIKKGAVSQSAGKQRSLAIVPDVSVRVK